MTRCPSTRQGLRCRRHTPHPGRLHGDGEVEWSDAEADPTTPSAWALAMAPPITHHSPDCYLDVTRGLSCRCDVRNRLVETARTLDAAHAQGRRDERADVVAYLRGLADAVGGPFDNTTGAADVIEQGAHVPAAADAGRADRGEG